MGSLLIFLLQFFRWGECKPTASTYMCHSPYSYQCVTVTPSVTVTLCVSCMIALSFYFFLYHTWIIWWFSWISEHLGTETLSNSWPMMHERWQYSCICAVWKFWIGSLPLPTCYNRSVYLTFKDQIYTCTDSFILHESDISLSSFVWSSLTGLGCCLFGMSLINGDFIHHMKLHCFISYQLHFHLSTSPLYTAMTGWPLSNTKKAQNAWDAYEDLKAWAIEAYKMNAQSQMGREHIPWHKILWIFTGRRQGGQLNCVIIHWSTVLLVGGVGLRLMLQSPG